MVTCCPTARAPTYFALQFDLLSPTLRDKADARLVELFQRADYHLDTGFLSTLFVCRVLTRFGHVETAFRLVQQDTLPSWLYEVESGATTMWKRWDAVLPDGTPLGRYAWRRDDHSRGSG